MAAGRRARRSQILVLKSEEFALGMAHAEVAEKNPGLSFSAFSA
jgi:hypothetical protein